MARDDAWAERVLQVRLGPAPAGWGDLARAAAQWGAGRPSLYGIPASIPALRIGETVYHAPHEPASLSTAAARLVIAALARADADRAARAAVAERLRAVLSGVADLRAIRPLDGAVSGELRLPVLRSPVPAMDGAVASYGVVRSYPRPLDTEPEARSIVWSGEPACVGTQEICDTLWTLPTHRLVSERDIRGIAAWAAARI
jgi:hypothetical protein